MPRILRLHSAIGPDGLQIDELPEQKPGEGEIRIRVQAFALNWGDTDLMQDNYTVGLESLPARIGSETVGIVDAVGEGVPEELLGRRMCSVPYFYGANGQNGESAVMPAEFSVQATERLNDIEACSVWGQYLTAYFPVVELANTNKDSRVLISAATSTAGWAALQMCKLLGATVICTTRHEANREYLLEMGADLVVASESENTSDRVNEFTNGEGVTWVFDAVGGNYVHEYVNCLADDALVVIYGGLYGELTALPEFEMTARSTTVKFYSVQIHMADTTKRARAIDFVSRALDSGDLGPNVDRCFLLEDYRDAFSYMRSTRSSHGKIVIDVSGS